MDITKYDATVHPKEWVNKVQAITLINNIRQEKDVLKLCKLHINSWIVLNEPINTLNELIKALKAHPSFELYKNSIREKLDQMKFEDGNIVIKFLAEFRLHCNNAEITDPHEIKTRLLKTYLSNEFFQNEFPKRVSEVKSIDKIFIIYSDVVSDSSKIIEYSPDCLIAIKHVKTGRYLSSYDLKYVTGSKRQVVSAFIFIP
jgi:hypothetical protein